MNLELHNHNTQKLRRKSWDPYEFNNHTRTCIVSKNTSEEEVNTSDINPLPTLSTSSTKHINNTRICKLCYKIKSLSDYYKGKYRCIDCLKEKVKCPQCNISLTSSKLLRHVKEVHQEKIKHHCLKCNKYYCERYFKSHRCKDNNSIG